jgi:glycosyltransferase involved in cell wall biosynthesis
MRRPVRVVYLAHAFAFGGAEEMVLSLVRHLPAPFEPRVMCVHHAGPIGEEIVRTGVPVEVLGLEPGVRRPLDLLRLRDALLRTAPDIVHTFLLTGSLYGRFAAMLAGVPIVIGTEVNIYERKQPWHIRAERWLMNGSDAVVASAKSVRDFYVDQLRVDPAKIEVIYNAVDFTQLQTSMTREAWRASIEVPPDATVVGIIARLTAQKAHDVLFQAIASRSDLAGVHVAIVGDGERRQELERLANTLGIDGRVRFLGARRDLGDILHGIDVFAMPSLWEGLPLSLVLAMGAGLPVVTTRVAGIPEVVEDGSTGYLVPPGDAAQFGAALSRAVHERDTSAAMGRAARQFVLPRFGVDQYVNSVSALYHRFLTAKGLA